MRLRRLFLFLASAAAMAAVCAPARADDDPWAGLELIEDSEMADLRGGIRLPNGLDLGLGAIVTTYSNGAPVLQTQLTWTDSGAMVDQTIAAIGQNISDMTTEQREALGLEGITGGLVIEDADGVTALVQNVTNGALQNIIINNANGRDLRQDIAVTLTLPNFEAMQDVFSLQQIGLHIDRDLRSLSF
jgi:hypothetical protein